MILIGTDSILHSKLTANGKYKPRAARPDTALLGFAVHIAVICN